MSGVVQYPKRQIVNSAFSYQLDAVEKMLIEVENQPPSLYTNNNQKNNYYSSKLTNAVILPSLNTLQDSRLESLHPLAPSTSNTGRNLAFQQSTAKQHNPSTEKYVFDPFKPVDLSKDIKNDSNQILTTNINSGLTGFNTSISANIWGNNNGSHGLSNSTTNTTVWA